ncbi:MAG: glycyl-radical enzyme activating protein [Clostridiaceae bacterium]|nr:glycyl-radical enzyme activating protein [Clostridiaceae bacterium]
MCKVATGIITNIQKFSIQDGPGIRTTVFLKGCPLHCLWCHNPEGLEVLPELAYRAAQCIGCGHCTAVCPKGCHTFNAEGLHRFDRTNCVRCGKCADACVGALELMGCEMTADEVLRVVLQDKVFYDNSGGGMTLSGGEPMFRFPFTLELARRAKEEGLHVCIETSGEANAASYAAIAPYIDIFLWDYKETDPALHKRFTGRDNTRILDNLARLGAAGASIVLRCPIIPGCNDRDEHFAGIARTAEANPGVYEVNVEPYHPLGKSKAEALGKTYPLGDLSFPKDETVDEWITKIQRGTGKTVRRA